MELLLIYTRVNKWPNSYTCWQISYSQEPSAVICTQKKYPHFAAKNPFVYRRPELSVEYSVILYYKQR